MAPPWSMKRKGTMEGGPSGVPIWLITPPMACDHMSPPTRWASGPRSPKPYTEQ